MVHTLLGRLVLLESLEVEVTTEGSCSSAPRTLWICMVIKACTIIDLKCASVLLEQLNTRQYIVWSNWIERKKEEFMGLGLYWFSILAMFSSKVSSLITTKSTSESKQSAYMRLFV